jgi:hypothetical protein
MPLGERAREDGEGAFIDSTPPAVISSETTPRLALHDVGPSVAGCVAERTASLLSFTQSGHAGRFRGSAGPPFSSTRCSSARPREPGSEAATRCPTGVSHPDRYDFVFPGVTFSGAGGVLYRARLGNDAAAERFSDPS